MKDSRALSGALVALILTFTVNITAQAGIFAPAYIGDFVWNDMNGDGVQDAGEPGLVGIDVRLCGAQSDSSIDCTVLNLTDTTDANGNYQFTDTQIYSSGYVSLYYTVEIVGATVPSGFNPTTPTSLFFATGGGVSSPITTADFGFQYVPIPAAVWLFGSGLLGLVGIARHKKSA